MTEGVGQEAWGLEIFALDSSLCLPVRVRTQTGSEPSKKKPVRAWREMLDLLEKLLDEEGTS